MTNPQLRLPAPGRLLPACFRPKTRHLLLQAGLLGVTLTASAADAQRTAEQTAIQNPPPIAATTAQQADEPLSLSGNVAMGAEYNSNLSVTELESSSGQSDVAGTVDANANVSWEPNDRFAAEGGYSYSASRYQDIDTYDLDLHLLFADLSYDFTALTLGTNYYFADADLGSDSFLTLNQYSLYAGKLFSDQWYLRGALNFTDKDFDTFNGRDADNEGYSVELYRFFNDGRTSVSGGYTYEEEATRDLSFLYAADTLRLRLNHRFSVASRDARFQLGYRLQDREYDYITPSIGVPRDDGAQVIDARLEMDVAKNLAVIGRVEHGNHESRLPSADFNDNRMSLALQLSF